MINYRCVYIILALRNLCEDRQVRKCYFVNFYTSKVTKLYFLRCWDFAAKIIYTHL